MTAQTGSHSSIDPALLLVLPLQTKSAFVLLIPTKIPAKKPFRNSVWVSKDEGFFFRVTLRFDGTFYPTLVFRANTQSQRTGRHKRQTPTYRFAPPVQNANQESRGSLGIPVEERRSFGSEMAQPAWRQVNKNLIRLHTVPLFSLSNWETGASEMRDRARDWSEVNGSAAVPLARSSLSITVDEKRKWLRVA